MITHIGMVAGQHKDGVLKPRFTTDALEELADGHVSIADTLLYFKFPFWKLLFVLLWDNERMVTGCSKDCRHEGLLHLTHLLSIIL